MTIVIAVVLGAAVVERLTRPTGSAGPKDTPVAELSGGGKGPAPPPPVRPTHAELVAEADRLADELAESFPADPHALSVSARVSFMLGSPIKAQQRWEQSLGLDSKWADAWLGLAELARKQAEFEKAVEYMRRLAEVDPALAREKVFLQLDCLLKTGGAQEAVDVLEAIAKIAPLPDWAHVMLGQGYYQLKEYEQSAEHYRQALDAPSQASVAHYGLSVALQRLGRQDEARKYLKEYARLQVRNMDSFDRMQRAGTAEERADPALWYPVLADFHFEAAKLYAMGDQRDRAREHALRAWALAPDRPKPKLFLESL